MELNNKQILTLIKKVLENQGLGSKTQKELYNAAKLYINENNSYGLEKIMLVCNEHNIPIVEVILRVLVEHKDAIDIQYELIQKRLSLMRAEQIIADYFTK